MIKEEKTTYQCDECGKVAVTNGDPPNSWYQISAIGDFIKFPGFENNEPLDICSGTCLEKRFAFEAKKIIYISKLDTGFNGAIQIGMNMDPKIPVNVLTKREIVTQFRIMRGYTDLNPKTLAAIDMALKITEMAAKAAGIGDNDPFEL
jgi:hypothetical protein